MAFHIKHIAASCPSLVVKKIYNEHNLQAVRQMEAFFKTHTYLIEHTDAPVRRTLMDEIDWSSRMIGIKGTRGIGKTTFLLQYAKENFDAHDRRCLYINMNNFYFQGRGIADFAHDFYTHGGRVLLIDQVFKQPDWSKELKLCYDQCPELKIVFTGSSVMRLKDENPELNGIVKSYNLRGFSFREYLNLMTGHEFPIYTINDITTRHYEIANEIAAKVDIIKFFNEYLHHGFYPFFREHRNFEENLLKTMNMMTEVDILLIKQIELKYLTKIKKLFYLLAVEGPKAPNISNLAQEIETSRATVMNYIKYLSDARLINMIYHPGEEFPKKPAKIMMHNPNLLYAIYPIIANEQDVMETFLVNALWKDHLVNQGHKDTYYIIDNAQKFRVINANKNGKLRNSTDTMCAIYNSEKGYGNRIPLWLFGFLY